MSQKRDFIISAAVFIITGAILSGLYITAERQSVSQNRERYQYIAANQSNIIRGCINTVLARAYTLSALTIAGDGNTSFFDQAAENIYQETMTCTGVTLKNIGVAPDGVVEKVYPLIGNEELIGFNFMDESKEGNSEAIAAYKKGELVITNPFELVQGGTGMAGRLPVFLMRDGAPVFWGLVTVTMDFDELMETIRMEMLSSMGVNYELWYEDSTGERIVMSASEPAPAEQVSCEISIMNLTWHLDVSPSDGWVDYARRFIDFTIIFGIALLISTQLMDKKRIKNANEKLQRLAHLDGLTSCYSRQYVNTVLLNRQDGRWNDPSVKYSLAIIDIDYFKNINDNYGHGIGDRAIIEISRILKNNSKQEKGDCVIRHGGDEFILLFNDITPERFRKKLETILKETRKIHFSDYPNIKLTVSIGGEPYSNPEQSLYYEMIYRADEKLYIAKENGRDQVVLEKPQ